MHAEVLIQFPKQSQIKLLMKNSLNSRIIFCLVVHVGAVVSLTSQWLYRLAGRRRA